MVDESKRECGKVVARALCSQLGVCAMVILYCVAGAFIFEHLEKNNEQQICYDSRDEYRPVENQTLESLVKIVAQYPGKSDQLLNFQKILSRFRDNAIAIGYDGKDCSKYGLDGGPVYRWSWAGSLFFSVTVITTIGYGHIAPKTFWGRLVCIAYAVLGIPLMLLCLANIGDVMANVFRFIYFKICCLGCLRNKRKDKNIPIEPAYQGHDWNEKITVAPSVPPMSSTLPSKDAPYHDSRSNSPRFFSKQSARVSPSEQGDVRIMNDLNTEARTKERPRGDLLIDDDSDDEDEFDESKVVVPLTVTMVVIGAYIFGGAVLFGLWEGWDTLQSAYFCFVTLSTIGFGDVVPGTDFESSQAQAQLIIGCAYLLFGMAIVSMCFSLMQEEISAKFRWLGKKIGLAKNVEDDE